MENLGLSINCKLLPEYAFSKTGTPSTQYPRGSSGTLACRAHECCVMGMVHIENFSVTM
ncbi:MAG: hypothetical protein Q7U12_05415 [Undibacterium sp.]|nr:hypothetical protein [Undibacterium sp.]